MLCFPCPFCVTVVLVFLSFQLCSNLWSVSLFFNRLGANVFNRKEENRNKAPGRNAILSEFVIRQSKT